MSFYRISWTRRDFIESHFFEWTVGEIDEFIPDKELFLELNHPAELFYLAAIYNWDDGSLILEWILESPLCTRATASLLFWRASPDWYLKFDLDNLDSCPEFGRDGFRILSKIIARYKRNDFSEYEIEFDPIHEIESIESNTRMWEIPPGVYEKISGISVEIED